MRCSPRGLPLLFEYLSSDYNTFCPHSSTDKNLTLCILSYFPDYFWFQTLLWNHRYQSVFSYHLHAFYLFRSFQHNRHRQILFKLSVCFFIQNNICLTVSFVFHKNKLVYLLTLLVFLNKSGPSVLFTAAFLSDIFFLWLFIVSACTDTVFPDIVTILITKIIVKKIANPFKQRVPIFVVPFIICVSFLFYSTLTHYV